MEIKTKFSIGDTIYALSAAVAGELAKAVCGTINEINLWEEPNETRKKHVWYELYGTSMRDPIRRFNGTSWEVSKEAYSKIMCDEESSFATAEEVLAEKERRDSELKERQLLCAVQQLEDTIKRLTDRKELLLTNNSVEEEHIAYSRRVIKRHNKELKELEVELEESNRKLTELKTKGK